MRNQLSDLDELLQKVRNRNSKEYLKEAITSYRAGAYRAAVTSTWIAICVDLIEKVKELSVSNDSAAKKVEDQFSGIQSNDVKGMLNFENDILRIYQSLMKLRNKLKYDQIRKWKRKRYSHHEIALP